MNKISKLLVIFCAIVVLAGCGSEETVQTQDEIIKPGNTTEMLNADQTESLRKVNKVYVNGLTSITDLQAEFISKIKIEGNLPLNLSLIHISEPTRPY